MKIPKKILACILTVTIVFSNFPLTAIASENEGEKSVPVEVESDNQMTESFSEGVEESAEEAVNEEVFEQEVSVREVSVSMQTTEINGTCGDNATWSYDETNCILTISGNGAMSDYTSASKLPWYTYISAIEKVEIQDGITVIGKNAFSNASAVKEVSLPDSLTTINTYAFNKCTSLTSIVIPKNVTTLGATVFTGCTALTDVEIKSSNITSTNKAFSGAGSTTENFVIRLTADMETLPASLFYGCTYVDEIILNDGLTTIGNNAFRECKNLKSITLPDTVTTMGTNVFQDCIIMESIVIPKNVTLIDASAFKGCTVLSNVLLPTGLNKIGNYAFQNCTALAAITLPDGLTEIGTSVFSGCKALEEIVIPKNVTTLGATVFTGCTALTDVEIEASNITSTNKVFSGAGTTTENFVIRITADMETLPASLFYGCTYVDEIILNDGLTTIGNNAFRECKNLKSITFPDTVTTMGTNVFQDCIVMESIVVPKNVTLIDANAFKGCTVLSNVSLPVGLNKIGNYAFQNCTALTAITLPDGLTEIGTSVFSGCTALEEIVIPKNVTTLGATVFMGCTVLTDVEIKAPNITSTNKVFSGAGSTTENFVIKITADMETLPASLFYGCTYVDEIILNDGLTTIGNHAFRECKNLKGITLPDTVTTMGTNVFQDCIVMESIVIPKNVSSLASYAFKGCTTLTEVVFPDNLTSIGTYAFQNCTSYSNVNLPASLISIDSSAFANCNAIKEIMIPVNVETMGTSVFNACTALTYVEIAGDKVANVAKTFDGAGSTTENFVIEITADIENLPESFFYGCESVDEIILNNELLTIGASAFRECTDLTSISLPENVTTIGAYAFAGSTSLETIEIPDSVTSLGEYTFKGCTSLNNVKLSTGLETLGRYTFQACESLENIELPSNIKVIDNYAFTDCIALKEIMLPKGLLTIGSYAFAKCEALQNIIIPENVETMGNSVFNGCTGLTQVEIKSSKLISGANSFAGAGSATDNFIVKITADLKTLPKQIFAGATNLNNVELNDTLEKIDSNAFTDCTALDGIIIPDSVTDIGTSAFYNCSSLKKITLPRNIVLMGGSIFWGCTSLSKVVWNANTSVIPNSMFRECTSLGEFEIPENITEIGGYAFRGCTSLTAMEIPENVTILGADIFSYCTSLTFVDIKAKNISDAAIAFSYAGSLSGLEVCMPEGMTSIPDEMFKNCENLVKINIPATVTHIGDSVFEGCINIDGVQTTDGLTILQNWIIDYESSETELTIPDGVVGIADYVFTQNSLGEDNLTEVTFPDSLLYIGNYAFYDCEVLTTIHNTDQVKWVGTEAFYSTAWVSQEEFAVMGGVLFGYNGEAAELIIPENITKIEVNAFKNNNTVTKLIIPSYVETICDSAFSSSTIQEIYIENPDIQLNYLALTGSSILSINVVGQEEVTYLDLVEKYGARILPWTKLSTKILDSWYVGGDSSLSGSKDGNALSSLIGRYIARKAIEEEGITDIKEAYDWVCRNVSYGSTTGVHSSYAEGGFFQGVALCQGTAMVMKAFLDELNYPNYVITGTCKNDSGTVSHAWNQVYVGGSWYNIDATDTSEGDYSTFMNDDYYISSGFYNMLYTWDEEKQRELKNATWETYEKKTNSDQPLEFTSQSDGTYWVTDCEIGVETVTIPTVHEGVKVTGIGAEAFKECSWLEEIVIPEGIESIGNQAFRNCLALKKVVLPSTLKVLEGSVFKSCVMLKEVDLSNTQITNIYSGTFVGGLNLIKIKLPVTIQSIENSCISPGIINSISGKNILTIYGFSNGKAESFADSNGFGFVSIGVTPHVHTMKYVSAKAATCTSEGNIEYYNCSGCEKYYMDADGNKEIDASSIIIAKTGHDFSNYISNNDATCTVDGTKTAECKYGCGTKDTVTESGSAKGHIYVTDEAIKATCTTSGLTEGKHCSVCNEILVAQQTIPAYGHDYTVYTIDKRVTCTTDGSEKAICNNGCGTVTTRIIKATGHKEVIDAAVAATCTATGLTEGKHCSVCNEVLVAQKVVGALGHKWSEWTTVTAATYTKAGLEKRQCSVCGESESQEIPVVIVKSITLNQTEITLPVGENITLKATCIPIKQAEGEVSWASSDEAIATVDGTGKVTAVSDGTVTITAKLADKTASCTVTVITAYKPEVPANLKAVLSGGHDDVKLTWSASEHATGYYVYYKTSSASDWSAAKTTSNTTYTFKDLSDNVTYNFKVVAYHQNGDNIYYDKGKATTVSLRTKKNILAPSSVKAVLYGYDDVKVSWTKSANAAGYYVYYKKSTASTYTYFTNTTALSTKIANLSDGVQYTVKVVPYYKNGTTKVLGYYSKTASVYTLKTLKAPVVGKYSSTKAKVSWENISGETGYQISQSTSKTGTNIISTYATTSGNYKTFTVTRNKNYYYKVRAYKTVGNTKIYGPWSAVTAYNLRYVAAQGTVTAALYGYDDVKLSWKTVTGANAYEVYYKKSTASTYTKAGTTTGTSYKKANLLDGVSYTFKVIPVYKSGGKILAEGTGKTVSITTLKALKAPTVSKYSSTKVKVVWNNISGETGYQISQSTSKTGTKIVATYATTSGTNKTLTAKKGTTYYYKVRAYKTVGSTKIYGPWSTVTRYKLK